MQCDKLITRFLIFFFFLVINYQLIFTINKFKLNLVKKMSKRNNSVFLL